MKKAILILMLFVCAFANAQTNSNIQISAPGGVNFGSGSVFLVHSGNGAPASSCTNLSEYIQLDAPVGSNIWQCINGTMVQQSSSGNISSGTIGQIARYTSTTSLGGINTTGTAGYVVLSGGTPSFSGSPFLNTATATSINSLNLFELSSGNIGIGNNTINSSIMGNYNIGIGDNTMPNNILGIGNSAFGTNALQWYNTSTGYNVAVGYNAGCCYGNVSGNHNITSYYSTYLGAGSSPMSNGDFNETVIGYATIGNGPNTVTIGNSNVTQNYFTGTVNATNFSGQWIGSAIDVSHGGTGQNWSSSSGIPVFASGVASLFNTSCSTALIYTAGGTISCAGSISATSLPWSGLTAPTSATTITAPTNDVTTFSFSGGARTAVDMTWTAGADSGSPSLNSFLFQDTTGDTSTGSLVAIKTIGTSTEKPITITAQGISNGIQMDATGAVSVIGTGSIAATTALNLTGTTTNAIPYQSGSSITGYLTPSSTNGFYIVSENVTSSTSVAPTLTSLATSTTNSVGLTVTPTYNTGVEKFEITGSTYTGTATNATNAYVTSTSSGTVYPVFSGSTSSGNQGLGNNSSLSFNASSGALTATSFSGNGASLTNLNAGNIASGIVGTTYGGTNCSSSSLTCFNNITGFSTGGTSGSTSSNLVFSGSPTLSSLAIGNVPLTINGFSSGQTADLFDVFQNSGGTKEFYVTNAGNVIANGSLTDTSESITGVTSGASGYISLKAQSGSVASAATNNILLTVPTSVTAYALELPNAQPTSGNTYLSCTAANPSICSWSVGGGGSGTVSSATSGQVAYYTGSTTVNGNSGFTYSASGPDVLTLGLSGTAGNLALFSAGTAAFTLSPASISSSRTITLADPGGAATIAYTNPTSSQTLDNTAIGGSTPLSGKFTTVQANTNTPASAQGGTLQWNYVTGQGETDFMNYVPNSSVPGGFRFYNQIAGNTPYSTTPIFQIAGDNENDGTTSGMALFQPYLNSSMGWQIYNNSGTALEFMYVNFNGTNVNFKNWSQVGGNTAESLISTGIRGWLNGTNITSSSIDTGISRTSAAIVAVGNGNQGDVSGTVKAANFIAGNGLSAATSYGGYSSYSDGLVLDYNSSTGNGRISVGPSDGIQFYNGTNTSGPQTLLASISSTGIITTAGYTNSNVSTKNSSYSASATSDSYLICNSSSSMTITLPTTSVAVGQSYYIKNIGTGTCTVAAVTGNIDNVPAYPLQQWQSVTVDYYGTPSYIVR